MMALLLLHCGGHTITDSSGAPAAGGAGRALDGCAGAVSDGGCDAAGGEGALEEYARLHTACSLNVRVGRRGSPVCVDPHIR